LTSSSESVSSFVRGIMILGIFRILAMRVVWIWRRGRRSQSVEFSIDVPVPTDIVSSFLPKRDRKHVTDMVGNIL
jgi:hypothetical protein